MSLLTLRAKRVHQEFEIPCAAVSDVLEVEIDSMPESARKLAVALAVFFGQDSPNTKSILLEWKDAKGQDQVDRIDLKVREQVVEDIGSLTDKIWVRLEQINQQQQATLREAAQSKLQIS